MRTTRNTRQCNAGSGDGKIPEEEFPHAKAARGTHELCSQIGADGLGEGGADAFEGLRQVFGEHARFSGDGHEAGVADPTG